MAAPCPAGVFVVFFVVVVVPVDVTVVVVAVDVIVVVVAVDVILFCVYPVPELGLLRVIRISLLLILCL